MPQSITVRSALQPQDLREFLETIFKLYPEIDAAIQFYPDDSFKESYSQKQLEKHYGISFQSRSLIGLWMRTKPRDSDAIQKLVQLIYYYIGAASCFVVDGEEGPYSFWGLAQRAHTMLPLEESIQEFVSGLTKD